METMKDINRIKVVLVEKKRTNNWQGSGHGIKMVYEYFTAGVGNFA